MRSGPVVADSFRVMPLPALLRWAAVCNLRPSPAMPDVCSPLSALSTTPSTPPDPRTGQDAACGTCPARRAGVAGVSKQPNRTHTPHIPATLRWFPGASLIDIELPAHHSDTRKRKQQPRGRIKEWSAASRSRLKHTLGRLQREELGRAMIVTLTYPAECPAPDDHDVYKAHLHRFNMALRRRWPLCSGIWKLEFQARGAAHYHFMLFGLHDEPLEALRAWTRKTWYRIAHNGDKNLGVSCEQVAPVKSTGGAMGYFAKYLGKGDQTMPGNFSGRYWGKVNAARLPTAASKSIEVPDKIAATIRRIARKKMQSDVNTACWKRWLEHRRKDGFRFSRLQWQRAKSQQHGGAQRIALWEHVPAVRFFDEGQWWRLSACHLRTRYDRDHFQQIMKDHPLPKRWRLRDNDRVRLLCDASAFIAALARLDKPQGCFRRFAQAA